MNRILSCRMELRKLRTVPDRLDVGKDVWSWMTAARGVYKKSTVPDFCCVGVFLQRSIGPVLGCLLAGMAKKHRPDSGLFGAFGKKES